MWNVQGKNYKEDKLEKELKSHRMNINIVSETRKKFKGIKDLDIYKNYFWTEHGLSAMC
jgi:hypothetical protein